MKRDKLKIIFGFPTSEGSSQDSRKRGVSLLIALVTIAMMVSFISDMIVTSSVNVEMAVSSRDRIKAEYLAKSGLNLAIFVATVGWGVDLFQAQPSTPSSFKKDLSDNDNSLWAIFNDLPPLGASTVSLVNETKGIMDSGDDPFRLKGILNEKVAGQMSLFEDNFSIKIEDEGAKININDCSVGRCTETIEQLINLFSCPVEKEFLRNKNINPEELAYRIKDFISNSESTSPESGYSDKNTPYTKAVSPYKTRGLPLDTVDELKLIDGWDDEIHRVFAPLLTVYPFNNRSKQEKSRININTAKKELLSCLVKEARSDSCSDQFYVKLGQLKQKKGTVAPGGVSQALKNFMCYTGGGSDQETGGRDKTNPEEWFTTQSPVLRLIVNAETGRQSVKLVAVMRKIMPKDAEHGRAKQNQKRSYEIMYWRLI